MTKEMWFALLKKNQGDIETLLINYHPSQQRQHFMRITAPNAELASQIVRDVIAHTPQLMTPMERFHKYIETSNLSEMINLLNEIWFGMPESTAVWEIRGFAALVNLLEDVPE